MDRAFAIALFFYLVMGAILVFNLEAPSLQECEKKHNVYECELVAVPKEKQND